MTVFAAAALLSSPGARAGVADPFEQLKSLAGEWEADLAGFGKLTNSIHVASNGKAIEETIGTAADSEVSVYTHDQNRILLTHFCAMTPDGHVARLETASLNGTQRALKFVLRDTINLHAGSAPHMRRVVMTLVDDAHFSEKWTKIENGKDTVFELTFVRR